MIAIRTITYNLPRNVDSLVLKKVQRTSYRWVNAFDSIHTQRLCLCPIDSVEQCANLDAISEICDIGEIRWFNLPLDPYISMNSEKLFDFCHEVISGYGRAFCNVHLVKNGKIDFNIAKNSAQLIKNVSHIDINGKNNFRLGCSVNIKENGAFFPFTYSNGLISFSIGLEMIGEINAICEKYHDEGLEELQKKIFNSLNEQVQSIFSIAKTIEKETDIKFYGFDFSIAPEISKKGSIISLLNRIGVYNFGKTGVLFATSFYTNILKTLAARYPCCGFSGIMYSLLEDMGLSMINNEKGINLDELIKLSTMCGCGVDMVPVSDDITIEELLSIFLDVYAISTRLNKPLGIRILPIPLARKNMIKYTNFSDEADFICNTKVLRTNGNILHSIGKEFAYISEMNMNIVND